MVKTVHHIIALFRLIRWTNLLIIAATQVFIRVFIIVPILHQGYMEPLLSGSLFIMLILATVFISAGGYAINDYFDRKIDRVNKPDAQIVGRLISPRYAMLYHMFFTSAGIILGTLVAYLSGQLFLAVVFFVVSGLLWFYSTTYKRELILGNVIVALLTALVPFIILLFEINLLAGEYGISFRPVSRFLFIWVAGFSFFAFLLNLIREIIKDVNDFKGDQAYGKRTIPVIWGFSAAKHIISALTVLMIILIGLAWWLFVPDMISLAYFLILFILPLIFVLMLVNNHFENKFWHRADIIVKCIMLAGLGYMVVVSVIIKHLT